MSQELKIAILPYDVAWGDKEENLLSIGERLRRVDSNTDIVVLPELFTTGVVSDSSMVVNLAETNQDKTIRTMMYWAYEHKFAICGSFLATTSGNYYNRAFFIEPSGEVTFYDKRHLFSLEGEPEHFVQGKNKCEIIRYRGWNIFIVLSNDIRFPIWCRNIENQYDIMITIASWPSLQAYSWRQLLIARAIENQAYVVGGNRGGSDDYGLYNVDDSICVDFKGNIISQIDTKNIIYAHLSNEELKSFRQKYPNWKDADKFTLL